MRRAWTPRFARHARAASWRANISAIRSTSRSKDRCDLLIGASVVVQDTIRDILIGEYPDDGFLGEEGPDDEVLPVNAERLWIVDPIDGSSNYFQGVPHFGISIGYRDEIGR